MDASENGLFKMATSLYIHIPFCHKKCPYCSFVVSIGHDNHIDRYLDCLAREAALYRGEKIRTVYIGGGTPSYLNDEQLKKLFAVIYSNFDVAQGTEWTFEVNPEDVSSKKFTLLRKQGVNRLSVGIQSFDDEGLKYTINLNTLTGESHLLEGFQDANFTLPKK